MTKIYETELRQASKQSKIAIMLYLAQFGIVPQIYGSSSQIPPKIKVKVNIMILI